MVFFWFMKRTDSLSPHSWRKLIPWAHSCPFRCMSAPMCNRDAVDFLLAPLCDVLDFLMHSLRSTSRIRFMLHTLLYVAANTKCQWALRQVSLGLHLLWFRFGSSYKPNFFFKKNLIPSNYELTVIHFHLLWRCPRFFLSSNNPTLFCSKSVWAIRTSWVHWPGHFHT